MAGTTNDRLLIHLAGQPHALPLGTVLDVCRSLPITPVPGAPSHVLGVAAWRGRLIPCIGLHRLRVSPGLTVARQGFIVVVRLSQGDVGLEVEAPVEVMAQAAQPGADEEAPPSEAALAPTWLDLEALVPRYDPRAVRHGAAEAGAAA